MHDDRIHVPLCELAERRSELEGPSRTIIVEPIEAPDPRELPAEPERTPEPVHEPEKVPA